MIIGTAGHIDHGKTTLVRALTGVETDRLKEEKARGISIELGYAYTPLANGDVLGIIDVPGHEKFVHTMAAGAVGIDHALLVVAADDGVMPQTLEHLEILQLLGIRQGTVALTKVDRVPRDRIDEVRDEITAILARSNLADAPVFETAAALPDDPGVRALRQHLHQQAQAMPQRANSGLFRLAVDRVFSLPGQGTVVTGTVFNGQVAVGDSLVHSASGAPVRVRSIHAQNQASEHGLAGQRCALNLAGIAKEAITRGDWIMDARLRQPTQRIDVRLHLLADAAPLAQWSAVHLHLGTMRCTGHCCKMATWPRAPKRWPSWCWMPPPWCCRVTASSCAMPRPAVPLPAPWCSIPMRPPASAAATAAWPTWPPWRTGLIPPTPVRCWPKPRWAWPAHCWYG